MNKALNYDLLVVYTLMKFA